MPKSYFIGVQSRGVVALPVELRRRFHLDEPGAQVQVTPRDDGVLELRPLVAVPADQAWFADPKWLEGERAVDEHVKAGETNVFESVDELFTHIDEVRGRRRRGR